MAAWTRPTRSRSRRAPRTGAQNVAIKRHTFRTSRADPVRGVFHLQAGGDANSKLSETDVRSVGFLFDLQAGDRDGDGQRVMPHLRFLNAQDGQHLQKWQFKRRDDARSSRSATADKTVSHYHLSPEDWEDLPDGAQRLCYNEIPTKMNWTYLALRLRPARR